MPGQPHQPDAIRSRNYPAPQGRVVASGNRVRSGQNHSHREHAAQRAVSDRRCHQREQLRPTGTFGVEANARHGALRPPVFSMSSSTCRAAVTPAIPGWTPRSPSLAGGPKPRPVFPSRLPSPITQAGAGTDRRLAAGEEVPSRRRSSHRDPRPVLRSGQYRPRQHLAQAAVRQLVVDDDLVMICGPWLSGSPPP